MASLDLASLPSELDLLERRICILSLVEFGNQMRRIMEPLLDKDGYGFMHFDDPEKGTSEHWIGNVSRQEGVEIMDFRETFLVEEVEVTEDREDRTRARILESNSKRITKGANGLVLVGRGIWGERLKLEIEREFGAEIQLVDIRSLRVWHRHSIAPSDPVAVEYQHIVEECAFMLACLIARKPSALPMLEWREVERVFRTVFAGLGFEAEITPPARDGGKDIILRIAPSHGPQSYFVEIKHWDSPVASGVAKEFLSVVLREDCSEGLLLATSGFSKNIAEALVELPSDRLQLRPSATMVGLCKLFVRTSNSLFLPPRSLRLVLDEADRFDVS